MNGIELEILSEKKNHCKRWVTYFFFKYSNKILTERWGKAEMRKTLRPTEWGNRIFTPSTTLIGSGGGENSIAPPCTVFWLGVIWPKILQTYYKDLKIFKMEHISHIIWLMRCIILYSFPYVLMIHFLHITSYVIVCKLSRIFIKLSNYQICIGKLLIF